jgi:hypothetical protein
MAHGVLFGRDMKKLSLSTIIPSHAVALETSALAIVDGGASQQEKDDLARRKELLEKVLGLPGVKTQDPTGPNVERSDKGDDRGLAKPKDK